MKIRFGARTDVGLARQFNEDSYLVDEELGLFVVADGMGGAHGGEIASRMACDEIHRHIEANYDTVRRFAAGKSSLSVKDVSELLVAAVQQGCSAIYKRAREEKELSGMGTTVVVLLVAGEHLFMAHVGDSRIYLLRSGQIHQLTRDHSLVEELKRLGKISTQEEVKSKYRNAITRAVGIYETVQADTLEMMPLTDDRFLLCTDGLHSTTGEQDLLRLLSNPNPDDSADDLVRHANSKGGQDNITCLMLDVQETEPQRAELTQRKLNTLKSVPLFRYLNFEELLKVVSAVEEKKFSAGEVVFREEDEGDALYILLAGEVEVSRKDTIITKLVSGDHFGELSLIDRFPRSATVKALESCLCLVMNRQKFYELIREYSALSVKLLWCLARVCSVRLRDTTGELELARSLVARVRLPATHDVPFEDDDRQG